VPTQMELSCSSDYLADAKVIKFSFLIIVSQLQYNTLLDRLIRNICGLTLNSLNSLLSALIQKINHPDRPIGKKNDTIL
ncbi:hypothetical protein QUB08_28145, partial [Microcoleus sp. BR0-C5]